MLPIYEVSSQNFVYKMKRFSFKKLFVQKYSSFKAD